MFENIKTLLLLTVLTVLLMGIFGLIGSFFKLGMLGVLIGFIVAIAMNFGSYFFSDKIVLKMYGAKEVSEHEAPELHSIVSELAQNAGIPKPKVAIVENSTPNAFATGRNPKNAVVAVTTGILNLLSRDELEGVIAHELGHVKNRDILISAVAATVAGAIILIADYARFFAIFGGGEDTEGLIAVIAMSILAPIAAMIVQLAISRTREYKADESGARISGKPWALADALRKLQMGTSARPMDSANPATAHMFIVNPFGGKTKSLMNLFSTHPPINERIKRLEELRSF
jgi:heat shock protein HtpX